MTQPLDRRLMTEATFSAKATEQDGKLDEYKTRIESIEKLGGLAPGDTSDATVASLVANSESSTKDKLRQEFLYKNPGTEIQTVKYNGEDRVQFRARGIQLVSPANNDDSVDRTTRITIPSYQGGAGSQYGEGIRLMVNDFYAKNMIAWYDEFTEPGRPKLKAWIGYHHGTYLGTVHDHISIETPDANGALNTRFAVSTTPGDVTNIDFNMGDVQHTASQGGKFRLAVSVSKQTTHPRELIFATGVDHSDSSRRWGIQADSAPETGNSAGSNLRINRYDDNGNPTGTAVTVYRSNGRMGINAEPDPSAQVNIQAKTQALRVVGTNSDIGTGLIRAQTSTTVGVAFDTRVGTEDKQSRFTISGGGEFAWGDGTNSRDTFLRRSTVHSKPVIRSSNELHIDTPGSGLLLTSPNGSLYRLRISDTGEVSVIKL